MMIGSPLVAEKSAIVLLAKVIGATAGVGVGDGDGDGVGVGVAVGVGVGVAVGVGVGVGVGDPPVDPVPSARKVPE